MWGGTKRKRDYGFDFDSEKLNIYLIFTLPRPGNEAKRDVEFHLYTKCLENSAEREERKCLKKNV